MFEATICCLGGTGLILVAVPNSALLLLLPWRRHIGAVTVRVLPPSVLASIHRWAGFSPAVLTDCFVLHG